MTDYFVVCHDQELTGQVLADPAMRRIKTLKILFVGNKAYNGRYGDKVIVCRGLRHNIEHMQKLVAYTGWHAIVRNNLSSADNICVLEYDIAITDRFEQVVDMTLAGDIAALGFVNTFINSKIFLDVIPEFRDYANAKYKCDMQTKILESSPTKNHFWPSTSNLAMKREFLYGFVKWYDSIIPALAGMDALAFVHERATIVYAKINGYQMAIDTGILKHLMKHSHNEFHD